MLHITGNDGQSSRMSNDSFGTGASSVLVQRSARGTAASPTASQSGDILARITGTGYGTTGYPLAPGNIGTLGIDFVALENYTDSVAGSAMKFYTSPIGALTKTLSANITANVSTFASLSSTGNVVSTGNIYSAGAGTVGYGAGSGGTVTQSGGGGKSAGVTLNKASGQITMANNNLGADTSVSFVFTNSTIGTNDLLLLNIVGGVVTAGCYNLDANCTTGSATVTVRNITGGTLGEAIVLRYAVIRGSIA
jgi:hypothetical protein